MEVNDRLAAWFRKADQNRLPMSGHVLAAQADIICAELEQPSVSTAWLDRWKINNNIKFRLLHGDSDGVDVKEVAEWSRNVLPSMLKDYAPENIYNADECGLAWRTPPNGIPIFV